MTANLKLHQAHRRDIPRLAELWAHAFPGERTVEERIRQLEAGGVYGGIDQAWYLEADGVLAGAFRGYRLQQYLHGTAMPMLGLAAVAVAPHARRAGVGATLCRHALRVGRERGDVVSVLYPFRPDFYYRLGWGLVGTLHAFRFRTRSLPVTVERPAVRLAVTAADEEAAQGCYARVARQSHGLIERNLRIWRNHLTLAHRHLFLLGEGRAARGYVLVSYGRTQVPEQRLLHVHELVASDEAARAALLSWLSLQRDEWPEAEYHALPKERFDLLLSDPRPARFRMMRGLWSPAGRRIRGPMLRVLDVPRAIAARAHWPEATSSLEFTLRVRDPELPENEGPWLVSFDGRAAACTPAPAGRETDVVLGAAEFAQWFAGELSLAEAVWLGRASCRPGATGADALFRSGRTFQLLDDF